MHHKQDGILCTYLYIIFPIHITRIFKVQHNVRFESHSFNIIRLFARHFVRKSSADSHVDTYHNNSLKDTQIWFIPSVLR